MKVLALRLNAVQKGLQRRMNETEIIQKIAKIRGQGFPTVDFFGSVKIL